MPVHIIRRYIYIYMLGEFKFQNMRLRILQRLTVAELHGTVGRSPDLGSVVYRK